MDRCVSTTKESSSDDGLSLSDGEESRPFSLSWRAASIPYDLACFGATFVVLGVLFRQADELASSGTALVTFLKSGSFFFGR